jgi:hypothetical protein
MDPKDQYIQLLVNTRAQLELQILSLQKELNDVRAVQTQEKEEVQETQE